MLYLAYPVFASFTFRVPWFAFPYHDLSRGNHSRDSHDTGSSSKASQLYLVPEKLPNCCRCVSDCFNIPQNSSQPSTCLLTKEDRRLAHLPHAHHSILTFNTATLYSLHPKMLNARIHIQTPETLKPYNEPMKALCKTHAKCLSPAEWR